MAAKIENVIVLEIKDSSENTSDGLLTVLTELGTKRLLAKGINKPESKNRANLQIGSINEIEYFEARMKNKTSRLKKATLIKQPDYENHHVVKLVSKAVLFLKNFNEKCEKVFNSYQLILEKQYEEKATLLLTFLVANSLEYFGIMPMFEECVYCKCPNNLCDFSFTKGGFICGFCTYKKRLNKELKSIYYMFKNIDTFLNVCSPDINQKIYRELITHLIDNGIFVDWEDLSKN